MQRTLIIGCLGKDIIESVNREGLTVLRTTIAVKIKNGVQWYELVLWDRQQQQFAKLIPYLKKGTRLWVSGEPRYGEVYKKNDGDYAYTISLIPDSMGFVGAKAKEDDPSVFSHPDENDLPF